MLTGTFCPWGGGFAVERGRFGRRIDFRSRSDAFLALEREQLRISRPKTAPSACLYPAFHPIRALIGPATRRHDAFHSVRPLQARSYFSSMAVT
jgi:hypothetical protein